MYKCERSVSQVLHNLAQRQVVQCRPDPEHSPTRTMSECKNMCASVCDIIIITIITIIIIIVMLMV